MDFLHVEGTVNMQFDWRAPRCDVAQHRVCECSVPPYASVTKQGRHEFRGNFCKRRTQMRDWSGAVNLQWLFKDDWKYKGNCPRWFDSNRFVSLYNLSKTLYYKYIQLFNISDVIDVLCTQIRIILIDLNANIGVYIVLEQLAQSCTVMLPIIIFTKN